MIELSFVKNYIQIIGEKEIPYYTRSPYIIDYIKNKAGYINSVVYNHNENEVKIRKKLILYEE